MGKSDDCQGLVPRSSLCLDLASCASAITGAALSSRALSRADAAVRDVLGCIFAGAHEAATFATAEAMQHWSGGRSCCVGSVDPVAAPFAALVNGTAAHVLDFDDNFFPAITHASAVLVPALLAVGDGAGGSWLDLIEAYVVGLEVQGRLGALANPRHYASGWHATSTLGTIGAAAACAKLARLTPERTAWAISRGASLAGGSKLQFGTTAKPVHAGAAAMHGVLAARLAACGIDASVEIFEGQWGFLAQHAATTAAGHVESGPLAIEQGGLVAKLYPSCMSSHLGIDCMLALRARERFAIEEVERVECELPGFMVDNLRFAAPRTATEARFSMNHCAAVALIDGAPTLDHFTPASLERPDLRALAARVTTIARTPDADAADLPWGGDGVGRVILRNGRSLVATVRDPKGSPANPLSDGEAESKFRDCCGRSLTESDLGELSALLQASPQQIAISDITRFLGRAGVSSLAGEER